MGSDDLETSAPTVLIAGGGTAGHVLPGLAVAGALCDRGVPRDAIRWVGSARGIETELVPAAGYELVALPGRGIQRRLTVENVRAAAGLASAAAQGFSALRRVRPDVVLTLGGYASLGPALAAVTSRVPIVVAEQNARAGAANRLVGRFARACAVPVSGTDLPHEVVTGNPVRPEILAHRDDGPAERAAARAELGWPSGRLVVTVFAGSLGSRRINEAVVELVERWSADDRLHVHHVVGRRDAESLREPVVRPDGLTYERLAYEDRMDRVLAGCDVAVCRAGGTTVAELAVVGVPAVLVPLPIATRDHQTANAEPLRAAGAAVVVADSACTADRLAVELEPILGVASRRAEMAAAAHALGRPDAARAVAGLVLEAATGRRRRRRHPAVER